MTVCETSSKPKYLFVKQKLLISFDFYVILFVCFDWFLYSVCRYRHTPLNFLRSARILLEMCYYWFKKISVSVKIEPCIQCIEYTHDTSIEFVSHGCSVFRCLCIEKCLCIYVLHYSEKPTTRATRATKEQKNENWVSTRANQTE